MDQKTNDKDKHNIGDYFFKDCQDISEEKVQEYEKRLKIMEYQSKGASLAVDISMASRICHLARLPEKTDQEIWEFEALSRRYFHSRSGTKLGYLAYSQQTKNYTEKILNDQELKE